MGWFPCCRTYITTGRSKRGVSCDEGAEGTGLKMAIASVESWNRIGWRHWREIKKHARNEEYQTGKWDVVARKHTQTKNVRGWAAVACFSARQGLEYLHVESQSVAIQCMLRREGESGGKVNKGPTRRTSCRLQNARRRVQKESCTVRGCDKDANRERKGEEQEEQTRD
jgi:hypothetical protein